MITTKTIVFEVATTVRKLTLYGSELIVDPPVRCEAGVTYLAEMDYDAGTAELTPAVEE